MTYAPDPRFAAGAVPPPQAPRRPPAVIASIVGSSIVCGLALMYLIIVAVMLFADGFTPSSLWSDHASYRLADFGYLVVWGLILGFPIVLLALLGGALAGMSVVTRALGAVLLLLTIVDLLIFIVAFMSEEARHSLGHDGLGTIAWLFPLLLVVLGVVALVSYGFGWGYFRERDQWKRAARLS